ncbi:MAG: polysaccharide deacetylase family protein [Lachnospiraceae bacterium]|nr:polysaccharide deacetylase family protein [Lachnospiraceae bacterium]
MNRRFLTFAFVVMMGIASIGNSARATEMTDSTNTQTQTETTTEVLQSVTTPTEVKIELDDKGFIQVSWSKVDTADKYVIYRRVDHEELAAEYMTVNKPTIKDKKVEKGHIYYYAVKAVGVGGESSVSAEVYKFVAPDKPTITGTYTKKKKIKLSWEVVPAADEYVVYKQFSSGEYIEVGNTKKNSYKDSYVKRGEYYKYKVGYKINLANGKTIEKKSKACSVYTNLIDPKKKMVALTFDDGPGRYTQEIVDCLKENDARATFYVLGCNIDGYKKALKNADKIGCEIGNHSYDHKILSTVSSDEVKRQMKNTDAKIKKITGSNAVTMRCPGGGVNKTVQGAVGKPIILWSIDTLDWKHRNTQKTISSVMDNVKDGDIVLMHDIHEPTKRAALYLIPALKKQGYQLVTVSELAEYRGYNLKKGSIYHSLRKKK